MIFLSAIKTGLLKDTVRKVSLQRLTGYSVGLTASQHAKPDWRKGKDGKGAAKKPDILLRYHIVILPLSGRVFRCGRSAASHTNRTISMCQECEAQGIKRRNLFKLAGVGLTAAALAGSRSALASAPAASPVTTPDEALSRLKEGNRRFVEDAEACATGLSALRGELVGGQAPWAIILTCSDSRVGPELVFGGSTLGELFVVRNAGNVLDTGALGTIEYGTEHLKSPLVVVMGHSKCGAVTAACDEVEKGAEIGGSIGKMIQPILPIVLSAKNAAAPDLIAETVRRNAVSGARRIAEESHIVSELVAAGSVKVVAAVYDITTGKVEFIENLN